MWAVVRIAIGVTLAAAIVSKYFGDHTVLEMQGSLGLGVLLLAVFVESFTLASVYYNSGKSVWRLAVVVFSVLWIVSVATYGLGIDCGCFGSDVPGYFSMIINSLILVSLGWVGTREKLNRESISIRSWSVCVILGSLVTILFFVATLDKVALGRPVWSKQSLLGRDWSSLTPTSISSSIAGKNEIGVLLLMEGCGKCREVSSVASDPSIMGVDEITVVKMDGSGQWSIKRKWPLPDFQMKWSTGTEPFMYTPLFIVLRDNTVREVLGYDELRRVADEN